MIISSRQEGGANVVSEAIMANLPIIASKIDGNIGLLGTNYNGYYPAEDTQALTKLLVRIEIDATFLKKLSAQIRALKPQFTEKQELSSWRALLGSLSRVS